MAKTKLNILPVPTFSHLGVNDTERDTEQCTAERITVPENSRQVILQFQETDTETTVTVGQNAALKLIQIFGSRTQTVSGLHTALADHARLDLIQLYLGGDTVSEIVTGLDGEKSAFSAQIGYDLGSGDVLDVNLIANHSGRKSSSEITVNGVLRGSAEKTFKGTIDFKRGAAGAVGSEKENVILMSKDVCNKTVPVILCAEEDVVGNHGATIGRIDERQIFYMKSRGLSEEKIYELAARSKLMQIIRMIDDEDAKRRIYGILGWSDEDE